jgi:gentisate 1,2-dioxygenase
MSVTSQQMSAELADMLRGASLQPLWLHYRRLVSLQPDCMEAPRLWRWADVEPAVTQASAEVRMEDAERRALILGNPDFNPRIQTTGNLIAAIQILNAGDRADEHRHTMAAIRMIIEAAGGWTSVDGERFEMARGDLILTPAWTWHAHCNDTADRIVWFDGLDVPLVRSSLDAAFFQPKAPAGAFDASPHPADRWRFVESGLAAANDTAQLVPHSPRIHYPWASTAAALDRLSPNQDGSVTLRYVHPQTGGAVMPTIDCFMQRLSAGKDTIFRRSTSNAVCVVLEGEGCSQVGEHKLSWSRNDVFTIPHWTWASHRASGGRAHLFIMTDRELFRRLELLREEARPPAA